MEKTETTITTIDCLKEMGRQLNREIRFLNEIDESLRLEKLQTNLLNDWNDRNYNCQLKFILSYLRQSLPLDRDTYHFSIKICRDYWKKCLSSELETIESLIIVPTAILISSKLLEKKVNLTSLVNCVHYLSELMKGKNDWKFLGENEEMLVNFKNSLTDCELIMCRVLSFELIPKNWNRQSISFSNSPWVLTNQFINALLNSLWAIESRMGDDYQFLNEFVKLSFQILDEILFVDISDQLNIELIVLCCLRASAYSSFDNLSTLSTFDRFLSNLSSFKNFSDEYGIFLTKLSQHFEHCHNCVLCNKRKNQKLISSNKKNEKYSLILLIIIKYSLLIN
ncbi:hypothetical protein SNEBB_002696 [Seison nebaliae]|nr:hypothetical protein SNEBB_002696 [Seison nebaliae]